MNKIDRANWCDKSEKLNQNKMLAVGDTVVDIDNIKGVVIKINPGYNIENHGCIYVRDKTQNNSEYEHYAFFNWQRNLRVI